MARALAMVRIPLTPGTRAAVLAGLQTRRAHFQAAQCHHWCFERLDEIVEFVETGDPAHLDAALQDAPGWSSGSRYTELELT